MSGETEKYVRQNEVLGDRDAFSYKPYTIFVVLFCQYLYHHICVLVGNVFCSKSYASRALYGLGHFQTLFRILDSQYYYSSDYHLGGVPPFYRGENLQKHSSLMYAQRKSYHRGVRVNTPKDWGVAVISLPLSLGEQNFSLAQKKIFHRVLHNLRLVAKPHSYIGSIAQ